MPRINQLPTASSVAQTDVLAIDTPEKTYQVPRSILAPAPYIVTIPTGQWSGSGSDRYITVTASNVTADAMLYPFYDNASAALLNGPVWVIPAAGSFTIHTSAIPSGTVTISVLLAGIVGEAQYQVLADVYSKSQVDSIVQQSTAYSYARYENNPTTCVYKVGRVCFITCVIGSWYNSVAGAILRLGSASANGWLIPAGFRPIANCEIREALSDKRITVDTGGNVTCNEALSGVALRFSGCYICAE